MVRVRTLIVAMALLATTPAFTALAASPVSTGPANAATGTSTAGGAAT